MGQPTSPIAHALNARLIELIRDALDGREIAAVARASLIPRTTIQNIVGSGGRPVKAEQATRLAVALDVDPATWFAELQKLALSLGARPLAPMEADVVDQSADFLTRRYLRQANDDPVVALDLLVHDGANGSNSDKDTWNAALERLQEMAPEEQVPELPEGVAARRSKKHPPKGPKGEEE